MRRSSQRPITPMNGVRSRVTPFGVRFHDQSIRVRDIAAPQFLVQVGWERPGHEQLPLTGLRPIGEVFGDVTARPTGIAPYHR